MPKIAVIVPVFGHNPKLLPCLLDALAQQQFEGAWELILVDNNSCRAEAQRIRECVERVRSRISIKLLEENDQQSSYAARNKGIVAAAGAEYLAFTDADCRPAETWLQAGIACLEENEADLAGGNVCFTFADKPTAAEIIDASTSMQMERDIAEHGVTKTANLFVKRELFDELGLFDGSKTSGEDVCRTK